MNKYVYQIQGALENEQKKLCGLRVLVCNAFYFDSADVPVEILDHETVRYLEFRLKIIHHLDINKLPRSVQKKIRDPLGIWLDRWVLENFYGNTGKRKDSNPGLLETGK
jgi:hypothetical protein